MIRRLLYLTYISLENAPTSGSSVRPLKMKEAFESLGIEVKTFGGINNNLSLRKRTVTEVYSLLKTWKPDACYIEPPSGPMFYYGDVELIKVLHKMEVPIGIFYRDAYWKYPEFSEGSKKSISTKLKKLIIKRMQIHQWSVFRKNIDIIYFPSLTMAKEFDCPNKKALPPGCFVVNAEKKTKLSEPLQFIFVGGAAQHYGTFLTIEAFEKLNSQEVKAKLIYICPEQQWNGLGIDKDKYKNWLEVIHTSGDENLKPYYEKADVATLIAPRSFYRDFAVPIKIFEYLSYLKPILATDCVETARIVNDNRIGWVTESSINSIVEKLEELCSRNEEILEVRENMQDARERNLWLSRAEEVICDLDYIRENAHEA